MIEVVFENDIVKIIQYGFAFALLIIMILFACKKKRNNKLAKLKIKDIDEVTPVVVNYFKNGKFTNKTFWFVLSGLVKKGFYDIYKDEDDYVIKWMKEEMFELDNYDLEEYEEVIVEFLNPFLIEGSIKEKEVSISELKEKFQMSMRRSKIMPKVYQGLKNKISEEYGFLEKGKNMALIAITILLYYFLIFSSFQTMNVVICFLYIIVGIMIGLFLSGNKCPWIRRIIVLIFFLVISGIGFYFLPNIFVPYEGIKTWLLFFNPLLFFTICFIGTTNFANPKQQILIQKMNALKTSIKENLLNKNKINKKNIEKYYIIAEAFNISLAELPVEKLSEQDKVFLQELIAKEEALQYLSKLF